eukprot:13869981-Alexandrium_andersonii.AAC.1
MTVARLGGKCNLPPPSRHHSDDRVRVARRGNDHPRMQSIGFDGRGNGASRLTPLRGGSRQAAHP